MICSDWRVAAVAATSALVALGCSRPWSDYDPRIEDSGSTSNAALCGGVGVLATGFDDGNLDQRFWFDANGSAEARDGELVLSLPPDESACSHFGTHHGYDLSGRSLGLELVSLPEPPADVAFRFWVHGREGDLLEITIDDDTVRFVASVDGDPRTLASQRYDAAQHRFLRIREADGSIYWETSGDGVEWLERAADSVENLFDVHHVSLELAGQGLGNGAPAEIHIDDLIGGGTPPEALCPCSALTDDFEDGVASSAWDTPHAGSSCTMAEANGTLRIAVPAEAYTPCNYTSRSAYDLRGSTLSVELVDPPPLDADGYVELYFEADGANYFQVRVKQGEIHCTQVADEQCTDLSSGQHSPTEHRWLRFREQDGTVYFETSRNGVDWQFQTSSIEPFPVDAVSVRVGAGSYGEPTGPFEVRLDNLNVAP